MERQKNIKIRNSKPSDYEKIISIMPDWWNGRDLTSLLSKFFFIHFINTTFIVEKDNNLVGFLVGFLSQSEENVGYIHLVGVHPEYRKAGIGYILYKRFFDICKENNRSTIKSCTSPINKLSIKFHSHMGFAIEPGDGKVDGIPVTMNLFYNNDSKVLFKKILD